MPSAIAIRHVAFEDLGTLAPLLARRGFAVSYRDAAIDDLAAPDIAAADLLVVLGGPIGAYEGELYPFLLDGLSGLSDIARRLEAVPEIAIIRLDDRDIVRHPLVAGMLTVL